MAWIRGDALATATRSERPARAWTSALAVIVLVLTVAAIGLVATPPGAQTPRTGGTLVVGGIGQGNLAVATDPLPGGLQGTRPSVGLALYDMLYVSAPGEPKDGLAEKTIISPDGLTWTITLRSGVKFHDNTDLDAEAIKTNLLVRKNSPTFIYRSHIGTIQDVQVVDRRTVRLLLTHPSVSLKAVLAHPFFGIMSPTVLAKYPKDYAQNAVGTGPFKLDAIPSDQEVVLVRNPQYWGHKPYIDKLVFRYIPDASAALAALEAGDLDLAKVVPAEVDRVRAAGKLNVLADLAGTTGNLIFFNMAKVPFSDLRARQAVVYGTKRDSYVAVDPGSTPAESLLPPLMFGFVKQKPYPYDDAKARQLFAEAGVRPGSTLEMIVADLGQNRELAQLVAQDMARFGIKLNLQVDTRTFQRYMGQPAAESTWHLSFADLSFQYNDPEAPFFRALISTSSLNYSHYKSERLDQLLREQQATADPAVRRQKWAEIQRIVWEDLPVFPTNRSQIFVGTSKRLRDLILVPVQWGALYQYAWLDK